MIERPETFSYWREVNFRQLTSAEVLFVASLMLAGWDSPWWLIASAILALRIYFRHQERLEAVAEGARIKKAWAEQKAEWLAQDAMRAQTWPHARLPIDEDD